MIPVSVLVQATPIDFSVVSGRGLTLKMAGVPIVRGTWFQYYEADWSRGYYSSAGQTQKVAQRDANTVEVTFRTSNGLVSGKQTYRRSATGLEVTYHFEWAGEKPVKIECGIGQVWAPAIPNRQFSADGIPGEIKKLEDVGGEVPARTYVKEGKRFAFRNGLGEVRLESDLPFTVFDARKGYAQEWAEGKQLLWAGQLGLDISNEKPLDFTVRWSLDGKSAYPATTATRSFDWKREPSVEVPADRAPIRIPLPSKDELNYEKAITWNGRFRLTKGEIPYWSDFPRTLNNRIDAKLMQDRTGLAFEGRVSELGLNAGGFRITINPERVQVLGQDVEGLRSGLMRLGLLIAFQGGQMRLPVGSLEVSPKIDWRGVHLFVGPQARPFQKQLWERVLRPLGFNKVVLQCEQTQWDALKGAWSGLSMPKQELKQLFDNYRAIGVEPIPLIQSFGHAEWLFRNGKNLELAYNPAEPYSIDPRKPAAREMMARIWREAVDLLQPRTIHFGLDEVDMRGFEHNPRLVTELWNIQIPFLQNLAEKFGLPNMLWGDKCLGPGEAPDAALGDSKAEAASRRAVIRKGTWITDWHYKPDERPSVFLPPLKLWKKEGMKPIAATWYRPENIRGFTLAAIEEGAGILQTTWAGYESNEEGLIKSFNQFSAMVLALDYAVSGRTDSSASLMGGASEALRTLYFDRPVMTTPAAGWTTGSGERTQGVLFGRQSPILFQSVLDETRKNLPTVVEIPVNKAGKELILKLGAELVGDDGDDLAVIELVGKNGFKTVVPVRYGWQARASNDNAPVITTTRTKSGESLLRIPLPTGGVTKLRLVSKSSYAGFFVSGLALVSR